MGQMKTFIDPYRTAYEARERMRTEAAAAALEALSSSDLGSPMYEPDWLRLAETAVAAYNQHPGVAHHPKIISTK